MDPVLPHKIRDFQDEHKIPTYHLKIHIVAPKESFQLEEKPKDPLAFIELSTGDYYLLHKWGNDLSFTRRIYGFYFSRLGHLLTSALFITAAILFVHYYLSEFNTSYETFWQKMGLIARFILVLVLAFFGVGYLIDVLFDYNRDWNKPFKD
jgi:hypothetical protein